MPAFLTLIDKLRGRSLAEARFRAGQAGAILAERVFGSPGMAWPTSLDSPQAVARAFGAVEPPILGLRDPRSTAALLTEAMRQEAGHAGDAVLAHRFSLFGGTALHFGDPPDWHLEPRAGLVTPRQHWSRIAYLDPLVAGDKKIVWELNRQQFLMTLGRAYAATGDERYAAGIVSGMRAWMAANPPKRGINWASALEVAYRAIAWLWALFLIRSSPQLTPGFLVEVLHLIRISGHHIETNLSLYFSPNTHLTGEALSLYAIGLTLPFLPEAPRWRARGRDLLVQALPRQVRPDGTYFENATYYHRYTLDIFVTAAVLASGGGEPFDGAVLGRIAALADSLMAQIKPDGTHGYFGDDDGGRLLPLGQEALNDFRPALSNAATLLGDPALKACAGPIAEETLWMFGQAGLHRYAAIPDRPRPATSRALADGGVFVMRDGGGAHANQMTIDCGPHGALNCGHAHADALAFELAAQGRSLLMDAGTYTYTGEESARRAFRSTAFHNALTVDGLSSSEPAGPFSWASIARCHLHEWWSGEHADVFDGSHDGYRRLSDPVDCRRGVLFVKNAYWVLRDRAAGTAPHDFAQHFHFAPEATVEAIAGGIMARGFEPDAPGLTVASFAAGGTWSLESGWISTRYTDRRQAKVAVFQVPAQSSTDIVTVLCPVAAAESPGLPRSVETRSGRAFVIEHGGAVDLFAMREGPSSIATETLASDADWLWLRRRDGRPEALVIRDATTMTLDDAVLLRAPKPVGLALWRVGSELRVDVMGEAAELDLSCFGGTGLVVGGIPYPMPRRHRLRFEGGRPKIEP